MIRHLLRRVLFSVPVLIGVATLVFLLIHLVPGDPVHAMLGESASQGDVDDLRARLGLNRPLPIQYLAFLKGLAAGNLGTSLRTGQPVAAAIADRIPATFALAAIAMFVALAVAIPAGIVAAVWSGTWIDHAAITVALLGISMPIFWLGPLLALVFSVWLGWLPVSGSGTPAHIVLPALTLGAPLSGVLARITRASLLDELREPYVLAARARGVSGARAVMNHAFRNSMIPLLTVLGLQLGSVLTGAVITETIFAWPGIGRLLVQAIAARDYPTVQGCVLFIAVAYVTVNLVVDLLYGVLDPRIRYE